MMRRFRCTIRRGMMMVAGTGVVLALLAPAIQASREKARQEQCMSHLRQLALGSHQYVETYNIFPPGIVAAPGIAPERCLGWVVPLTSASPEGPQLEVDARHPWDEAPNWPPRVIGPSVEGRSAEDRLFETLSCPSARFHNQTRRGGLNYVGSAGLGPDAASVPLGDSHAGPFGYDRAVRFADIQDGLSSTMLFIETSTGIGPFTAGGPSSIRAVELGAGPQIGPRRAFGGLHDGIAFVALCDGTVKRAKETISPATFEALSTIRGGETIPGECMCGCPRASRDASSEEHVPRRIVD
jgi:hypothetical protein